MTKLESTYLDNRIDTMRSLYRFYKEKGDEKTANEYFHEWLALDSLKSAFENKDHMKNTIKMAV